MRRIMVTWFAAACAVGLVLVLFLARGGEPAGLPTPEQRGLLEAELHQALATGRKIDAIKAYRRLHGTDLKHSKDAVERAMAGQS
jgi:ribosomal protein L7/L12